MRSPFLARAISLSLSFVLLAPAAIVAASPKGMFFRDSPVFTGPMLKEAAFTMPLPDGWKFASWGEGGKDICREFFGPESPDRLADICWNPDPWDDVAARVKQFIRVASEKDVVIESLHTQGGLMYQRVVVAPGRRPLLILSGDDYFLTVTPYDKSSEDALVARFDQLVWHVPADDEMRDKAQVFEATEICTALVGMTDDDKWYREHSFDLVTRYLADSGGAGLDILTPCAFRSEESYGSILAKHHDIGDERYWQRITGLVKKEQHLAFLDQRLSYVITAFYDTPEVNAQFREIERLQELGALPVDPVGKPRGVLLGLLLDLGQRHGPEKSQDAVRLVLRFIDKMPAQNFIPSDWDVIFSYLLDGDESTGNPLFSEEMQMAVLKRLKDRYGQLHLTKESIQGPSPVQRAVRTKRREVVCLVLEIAPYVSDEKNDKEALAEAQKLRCTDAPAKK